jgi:hypothetical protein
VHVSFRTLQELRLELHRYSAQSHMWRLLPAISRTFMALCGKPNVKRAPLPFPLQERTYTLVPVAMQTLQRVWSERSERTRSFLHL